MKKITYRAVVPANVAAILAPGGIKTPYGATSVSNISGGTCQILTEQGTGQLAMLIKPDADTISLTYLVDEKQADAYPQSIFETRDSRFTRFADDLAAEAKQASEGKTGLEAATAIACAAAERFTYGHPEEKFNDGLEEIPALGCGLVEGSCVDINTYFIAALRAADIEAGYVTGFFFPEEKAGRCTDSHCWVVSRIDGETHEWDIAHHLKLGTRDIKPALNPKPGYRAACFHSMGLDFPDMQAFGIKAIIEPVMIADGKAVSFVEPEITLS